MNVDSEAVKNITAMKLAELNSPGKGKGTGKVYLIGAGPGDVELMTIKGMKCLQECDVILIDDLVNIEILQFAKDGTRIIEVGKRCGSKHTDQGEICELMVRFAEQGFTVGRLKGGDPFVFGRGGEELQKLRSKCIEYHIVSGITSGIAVPSSIGIPLTHREFSSGVTIVTGHSCTKDNLDWRAIAESKTTLVIYMGISQVEEISSNLIGFGMCPTIPVAVIENGTLPSQRSVITDLENLPKTVQLHQLKSPSIIVVGKVVTLCDEVDALYAVNELARSSELCILESVDEQWSTPYATNNFSPGQALS